MSDVGDIITMARTHPSTDNLEGMWRMVMNLPAWFLLPAAQGPTTPLVLRLEEGDWLVAFTHFRPLNEFAKFQGLRNEAGELDMLTVEPADVLQRAEDVAVRLAGVVFNPATDLAFRAPTVMFGTLKKLALPRP